MGGRGSSSHSGGGAAGGANDRFAGARDFLQRAYGITHAQAILNILRNAPDHIQQLWADFSTSFRAGHMNPNSDEAYYSPSDDRVYLGINDVARGDSIHPKYATVFHEYGHMTDYLIARQMGRGNYTAYSDVYESGKLGRTAKDEMQAHIDRAQRLHPEFTRKQAADFIINEAKGKYSLLDRSDISDMMEGAGIGVAYPLGSGHGLSYWNSRGNGKEIFAEMISAEAAHSGSLKAIKDYFPQTYGVYQQMIKERKKK